MSLSISYPSLELNLITNPGTENVVHQRCHRLKRDHVGRVLNSARLFPLYSFGLRVPALCRLLPPSVLLEAPRGRRGKEEGEGVDEFIYL